MGYMDLLKGIAGEPEPKQINQDGKQYTFTPGKNGSLTAPAKPPSQPLIYQPEVRAKKVPANPVQVGSSRG